MAEHITI